MEGHSRMEILHLLNPLIFTASRLNTPSINVCLYNYLYINHSLVPRLSRLSPSLVNQTAFFQCVERGRGKGRKKTVWPNLTGLRFRLECCRVEMFYNRNLTLCLELKCIRDGSVAIDPAMVNTHVT